MKNDLEDELKAILGPSQEQIERVVGAALAAQPRIVRGRLTLAVLAGAVTLMALLAIHAERERPLTEPLPVASSVRATSQVINFGTVMLVKGPSGRTLIANQAATAQVTNQQVSYRLMILKGTAQ